MAPKAHIPYRNDPALGKKTGIPVKRVARASDGFEPFDRVLKQASSKSPPRRKRKSEQEEVEEDDRGSDMELDSPVNYSTTPRATGPRTRPVSRGSRSDFDDLPSPRAPRSTGKPGPSRLSRTLTARELLEQDEGEDYDHTDNFVEEDNVDDDEQASPPPPPARGKGTPAPKDMHKRKVLDPVDEQSEEEEALVPKTSEALEPEDEQSDEEDEEAPPPPKKKPRPARSQTRKKERRDSSEAPEGVRRSKRVPIPPLEYWRGEKYVYGPRVAGETRQVPRIAEIVRIPKEPPARRAGVKRKRGGGHAESRSAPVREREVVIEVPAGNPEMGWDDDTNPDAVVLDYPSGHPVSRRVAFMARMFKPTPVASGQWLFEKIFGDDEFMAAGQLLIPPQSRKPAKGTKDNTYIFYVVEGAVSVAVCNTTLVLATGGMFMIPRGNTYWIENIAERDAKLFFTQARKVGDEEPTKIQERPPDQRGVSIAMMGSTNSNGA